MHIISRKALSNFYEQAGRGDAKGPLLTWYALAKASTLNNFEDVRTKIARSADAVGDRVVFDIGGNKYRLIVYIRYPKMILIKWVGTHAEYDRINPTEV